MLGALSFGLALCFKIWQFWRERTTFSNEERFNMFSEIFQYTNASPIIMTMIFLISFYMGLHQANILPPIYTGKVPVRYEKLLENSLKGEKEIIVGFPKHELYWGEFQNFLSQMKMRKGKIRER